MNCYHIIFILTLLSGNIFSQQDYLSESFLQTLNKNKKETIKDSEPCRFGIKEAVKDYAEGKGKYLAIGDLSSWSVVYYWHLENTLKLEVDALGCTPTLQEECYKTYATFKLKEIHGADIFEKLAIGTDSLFKIGKGIEPPKYVGGMKQFTKDINATKRTPPQLDSDKIKRKLPISVSFEINVDTLGNISDPKIFYVKNTKNKEWYEQEAIRIINNLGLWQSAIRFGEKIDSTKFITIHFGEKSKKKSRRIFWRKKANPLNPY